MSIKFTSRFSPSIVKAAELYEAGHALFNVSHKSELKALAVDSFNRGTEQTMRLIDGSGLEFGKALGQIMDCAKEMQRERKVAAQRKKAMRLARELAKEEGLYA